jgi:DNA-binding NarL/FixJ family response regulator
VSEDSPRPVEVLIVEDHRMLADGLASVLRRAGVEAAVLYPASRDEVVDAVRRLRPRIVLLDLDLGRPGLDGESLVAGIVRSESTVLLLTGCRDRHTLGRCLDAGARGLVSKEEGLAHLLDAVRRALDGAQVPGHAEVEELIAEARHAKVLDARRLAPFGKLTRREAAVLRALVEGDTVDRVAATSFVSVATVRSQVRSILLKLGVNTQLAAVAAARRSGWLDIETTPST